MRASVFMAEGSIGRLRRRIAEIERRSVNYVALSEPLPSVERVVPQGQVSLQVDRLDQMLGGGLRLAALHEIRSGESRNAAAVTGFAAGILARLNRQDRRPVLWIVDASAALEAGFLYGAGLQRFSIDVARLIIVRAASPADALWTFEEGLRCRGLSAVFTELRGAPRQLDLTASRRLALRAREHGVMGLLLRQADRVEPSAAATRWLVSPQPAAAPDDFAEGIGNPVWRLALERNRFGPVGIFDVEWDHERGTFVAAAGTAVSLPVLALSPDRPPAPSHAGEGLAIARAS